jgi:uncharacterized protein with NAD-binding domain and iron-sulfur cluster
MSEPRRRIAVLGGGAGALCAVYELTSAPDWADRYEITVYQLGWRLGGKGAAGRNAAVDDRIEEHGLHMWCGFYENAFRLIRRCYEDWTGDADAWRKAFEPHDAFAWPEWRHGRWTYWTATFPRRAGNPGDAGEASLPSRHHLVQALTDWLAGHARDRLTRAAGHPSLASDIEAVAGRLLHHFDLHLAAPDAGHDQQVGRQAAGLRDHARHLLQDLEAVEDEVRRVAILVDVAATILIGVVGDRLLDRGLDAIDGEEFRDWLKRWGASQAALDAPPLRGSYDACFAYQGGDPARPAMAAGVFLRGLLRMSFDYRGAIMWRMLRGMGDTIFVPLYEVLRRRGVCFQFFSRVRGLEAAGSRVSAVEIERQATTLPELAEYDPLVRVADGPAWPNQPRYEQLLEGDRLRGVDLESAWSGWPGVGEPIRLEHGRDFDDVLLGISVGALAEICEPLRQAQPQRWGPVLDGMATVDTQGVQLWLDQPVQSAGWRTDAAGQTALLAATPQPLSSACDMSDVLASENWPAGSARGLVYLCGPLPDSPGGAPPFSDHDYPRRRLADVRATAAHWLDTYGPAALPQLMEGDGFRWASLVAPEGVTGQDRLDRQYLRANVNPSDRYVLSLPGTISLRPAPGASGFDNLVLAGDWTDTPLNLGCVEAAVMSELAAASALSGAPVSVAGVAQR